MADGCNIQTPKTTVVKYRDISSFSDKYSQYVIKKKFCRFGTDVMVNITARKIQELNLGNETELLIQEKIHGEEICSYSIAINGNLTAHCCYLPLYRLHESASMYFSSIVNEEIYCFVKLFVKKHNYTGHISFDYIKNDNGVFLIECNPRASSGLHLLYLTDLAQSLTNENVLADSGFIGKPATIKLMMLLVMLPAAIVKRKSSKWLDDYKNARDVISLKQDKSYIIYQFYSLFEIMVLSIKKKKSMRAVSTYDIEWDGDDIT